MAFVTVARTDEVPVGQGKLVEVNGLIFAVFNAGGGHFHVTSAICPHEDGPLAEGWIEGDAVVCPWHGFDFELATGRCRVAEDLAISIYPVRVAGGAVQADLP